MNQITEAKAKRMTPEISAVAQIEDVPATQIQDAIVRGEVVVLKSQNALSRCGVIGIGRGLSTKINANVGTSGDKDDVSFEIEKLKTAEKYGADTVMDLSTGGDIQKTRELIIEASHIPVGTVPLYDVMHAMNAAGKPIESATSDDFLAAVEKHIEDGVDFVTVHCGVTREVLHCLQAEKSRLLGVVSRGGSYVCNWMNANKKENPLYERFDEIIAMAKKYDVVLSLGDGLRPGSLHDATDKAQLMELRILGELQQRALAQDVQVIIEGPGHVPLNEVEANVRLQKTLCNNAPFYVLGPIVTDIAPGYDHITSAIGGALAAWHGADYLCYVTPAEHLRLPDINDVKEGVIASKIAAHAADIAKYGIKARKRDDAFSRARMARDWETQIETGLDPEKARAYREALVPHEEDTCSMCGKFCSAKMNEKFLEAE